MDIKIIYLTNDTRRYAGMKNACLQLQDEMKISDLCMAVKLERSSEWNYVWERKLRGSSLVVARFFNNIFKSKFWEECSRFLDANHIPYVIDAVPLPHDSEDIPSTAAPKTFGTSGCTPLLLQTRLFPFQKNRSPSAGPASIILTCPMAT